MKGAFPDPWCFLRLPHDSLVLWVLWALTPYPHTGPASSIYSSPWRVLVPFVLSCPNSVLLSPEM